MENSQMRYYMEMILFSRKFLKRQTSARDRWKRLMGQGTLFQLAETRSRDIHLVIH